MISNIRKLAALGAAALALCSGTAHAEWLEATTKHFVVVGDMSSSEMRSRVLRLEQFDAAMRLLVGGEDTVRVRLYLLNSMSDLQRLAGSSSVGGFYLGSFTGPRAFMPRSIPNARAGFTPEAVLFHEYTHHMLLGNVSGFTPGWATEGLAEMFMTAKLGSDGSVTIGATNPAREWFIKRMSRWSIEELLRRDNEQVPSNAVIERYTRGWALCHYLWMSGKRPGQYSKFLAYLNESGDQVEAGRKAFGDLGKLNGEVDAYLRKMFFPVSKFDADQLKAPTQIDIRSLTPGEAAMMEMRMASDRGVSPKQAEQVYLEAAPVAARFPGDASVQTWFAEMAFDSGRMDEADSAADRALAAKADELGAMIYKGRVQARKALETGEAKDWAEARKWFLRANRVNPNDPLPFVLYYDSFTAAGKVADKNAVSGLFRAVMLVPQDMELRVRVAVELIRMDEFKQARAMLGPVAFNPHEGGENPAMKVIEALDAGKPKDEILAVAKEQKLTDVNDLPLPKPDEDGEDEGGAGDPGDDPGEGGGGDEGAG